MIDALKGSVVRGLSDPNQPPPLHEEVEGPASPEAGNATQGKHHAGEDSKGQVKQPNLLLADDVKRPINSPSAALVKAEQALSALGVGQGSGDAPAGSSPQLQALLQLLAQKIEQRKAAELAPAAAAHLALPVSSATGGGLL